MTTEEFAKILDGRQYGDEITRDEERKAKELGYVVVFGYSDDTCVLRGAIDDEIDCYDGGLITHENLPSPILAIWDSKKSDCDWCYETDLPHAKFNVFDGYELYCEGIVIDLKTEKELKPCPFCGGRAEIINYIPHLWLVRCTKCKGMVERWRETETEAREQWNRRSNNEQRNFV